MFNIKINGEIKGKLKSFWYNVNILANGFKAIYLNLGRGEKVFQVEKNIMDL